MIQLNMHIDDVFRYLIPILGAEGQRVIVEIGAHDGRTSDLLRLLCRERPRYKAFEPDSRNFRTMRAAGLDPISVAIASEKREARWFASKGETPGVKGRVHTDSSSLMQPTKHLQDHPWCEFEETIVLCQPLDYALYGIESNDAGHYHHIDLIWADVQGAQLEVIRGGKHALRATDYLFIEVHPEPLYAGEPTFEELRRELEEVTGQKWAVLKRYEADVLFWRPTRQPRLGTTVDAEEIALLDELSDTPYVVDVGGGWGDWTAEVLKARPGANVDIYEPYAPHIEVLDARFGDLENVFIYTNAVGGNTREAEFYLDPDDTEACFGNSLHQRAGLHTSSVTKKVHPLRMTETPELLKLDVEGGEFEILMNLPYKPRIIQFEYSDNTWPEDIHDELPSLIHVKQHLQRLGYQFDLSKFPEPSCPFANVVARLP